MDANTPLAGINDGYCVGPSSYSTRILGETQNLSDKNEWLHSSVLVLRVVMLLKVCLQLNLKSLRGRLTDSCVGEKQHNLVGCTEGNEHLQEAIRNESCKCL